MSVRNVPFNQVVPVVGGMVLLRQAKFTVTVSRMAGTGADRGFSLEVEQGEDALLTPEQVRGGFAFSSVEDDGTGGDQLCHHGTSRDVAAAVAGQTPVTLEQAGYMSLTVVTA